MKRIKKILYLTSLIATTPLILIGINSCSSNKVNDNNQTNSEFENIKNSLNSLNIYCDWKKQSNITYLSGYTKNISIINYKKLYDLYQNKVELRWYKDNIENVDAKNSETINCNQSGVYSAKIIYTPTNTELITFNAFDFKLLDSLQNITLNLSNESLTNQITSISATLNNIPNQIPQEQYSIKWFKDNIEQSTSNSFTINSSGKYGWKIINNANNQLIANGDFIIKKKIDWEIINPSNIIWNNIPITFNTENSIDTFDYNHHNIKCIISNLPTAFFTSNRYSIKIFKDKNDISNLVSLNIDAISNSVTFNISYEIGRGNYTYKIIDNLGVNSFEPNNQSIVLLMGSIVDLTKLNVINDNNGVVINNQPIESNLNITQAEISNQDEFLNYYDIVWIQKSNNGNEILNNNVFFINIANSGDYICKIIAKYDTNIFREINFTITQTSAIINYDINSPRTIIANTINDTHNTFSLEISNFNELQNKNYQIYLNENRINNQTNIINTNDLKPDNNILRLLNNNIEIFSYELDSYVLPIIQTLYLNDDNMTFSNIDPTESSSTNNNNTITYNTLTVDSINRVLFNKYSKLNIQSNKLTGFKSNAEDIAPNENKNSMGLPDDLDPYEWTGIFQEWTSLTDVNITAPNFEYLDKKSFYNCPNLRKITITSDKLFSIENYAFRDCVKLTNATMPKNVDHIGPQAFMNTTSLNNFVFSPTLKALNLQSFKSSGLTSVDISQCKRIVIGNGAFNKCIKLKEFIYYGVNITDVGDFSLTSKIPEPGLISIGESAFENCNSLSKFYPINKYPNPNPGDIYLSDYVMLGKNNFASCTSIRNLIYYPLKMNNVPPGLFSDSLIENFIFNNNIKSIGINSFGGILSRGFQKIIVPESVTLIEHEAFAGSNISYISLPSSLQHLGINFVSDCTNLSYIKVNFDHIQLSDDNLLNIDNYPNIKEEIFNNIFIDPDADQPLTFEFGENVVEWFETAPINSNKVYLTLQEFLAQIIANDTSHVVQYKCHSQKIKEQLITIGILESNITII